MYRNRFNDKVNVFEDKKEKYLIRNNKFMNTFSVILRNVWPVSASQQRKLKKSKKKKKKNKHVKIEVRFK